jgi:hypothetical protein
MSMAAVFLDIERIFHTTCDLGLLYSLLELTIFDQSNQAYQHFSFTKKIQNFGQR